MKKKEFTSGLTSAIVGYLDFREKRGFARSTYMSSLHSLDSFFCLNFPSFKTIIKDAVLDWISSRSSVGSAQVMHDCIAVRQLAEYMQSIGLNAYSLTDNFAPKHERNTPYIFTDHELHILYNSVDALPISKNQTFENVIAPVLFRLIYTCGLRPSEGRELERKNVNIKNGEILITHTKQHRERIVVMSDDMCRLCCDYIKKLDILMPKSIYLFPRKDGSKYTTEQMNRLFKKCWKLANPTVNPNELPHVRVYDLRHRFASAILNNWLDSGENLFVMLPYLRAYMGHVDISATAYYIHLLPENILKSRGVDWASLNNILPEVSTDEGV